MGLEELDDAGEIWACRFINKKKDGTLYTEDATISPLRSATGEVINYVAVKRDITRELTLENQFLQAQKMESVGRLAGGGGARFQQYAGGNPGPC